MFSEPFYKMTSAEMYKIYEQYPEVIKFAIELDETLKKPENWIRTTPAKSAEEAIAKREMAYTKLWEKIKADFVKQNPDKSNEENLMAAYEILIKGYVACYYAEGAKINVPPQKWKRWFFNPFSRAAQKVATVEKVLGPDGQYYSKYSSKTSDHVLILDNNGKVVSAGTLGKNAEFAEEAKKLWNSGINVGYIEENWEIAKKNVVGYVIKNNQEETFTKNFKQLKDSIESDEKTTQQENWLNDYATQLQREGFSAEQIAEALADRQK